MRDLGVQVLLKCHMALTKHNFWCGSITERFQSVNWLVVSVVDTRMHSAFLVVGPSMIDVMLFRNYFGLSMIRNRRQLHALSVSLPKNQNENAHRSLRETRIRMKRKQFRGPRDWQNLCSQTMISQYSAVCSVEHLVKSRKMKSKSHAVFI